jgi:hypothetical protein
MPEHPRCAATLRDGSPRDRVTATPSSEFCSHHMELLATFDAETLRQGRKRGGNRAERVLHVVAEAEPQAMRSKTTSARTKSANSSSKNNKSNNGGANGSVISPAEVRPQLARVTAESVEEIQQALLDAALGATREHWTTFACPDCGKKHRAQVQVPDVRARVGAIELLLREGLGRPATAQEVPSPRLAANVAAVKAMGWEEMQTLFAVTYADELAAMQRGGGAALVREQIASLSEGERRVLRDALETAG